MEPISKVAPFKFTDQNGNAFTNHDVDGKVYVAEFFFTTCPGICPMMNDNMRQVYAKFKNEPDFRILSYTCDPKTDSAARLKVYADSMQVNTQKWVFLTGRKDSLYNMARLSYSIDDPANNLTNKEDDFLHTQYWALVNRKGEVIKICDGLKQKEIKKLIEDIEKELKSS
nr:SCO family protein [Niabella ginsengisoli]